MLAIALTIFVWLFESVFISGALSGILPFSGDYMRMRSIVLCQNIAIVTAFLCSSWGIVTLGLYQRTPDYDPSFVKSAFIPIILCTAGYGLIFIYQRKRNNLFMPVESRKYQGMRYSLKASEWKAIQRDDGTWEIEVIYGPILHADDLPITTPQDATFFVLKKIGDDGVSINKVVGVKRGAKRGVFRKTSLMVTFVSFAMAGVMIGYFNTLPKGDNVDVLACIYIWFMTGAGGIAGYMSALSILNIIVGVGMMVFFGAVSVYTTASLLLP